MAKGRADCVAREFESRGLYSLTVLSAGEEFPVASNTTQAGREKNRRVEVWVN